MTTVRITSMPLLPAVLAGLLSAGPAGAAVQEHDPALSQYLQRSLAHAQGFENRYDAEVWLMSQGQALSRFVDQPQYREELLRAIYHAAREANLQPELVLAVIEVESRFDRFAISSAGAQGLMQVMPFWKQEIGRASDNLLEVRTNLRYGCHILHYYMKRERGNLVAALARYNGSYGQTWYPQRVMLAWQKRWLAGAL